MRYTLIDEATGLVLRKRRKPDGEGEPELKPGQIYIVGHDIDARTQLYLDGQVVNKQIPQITLTGTKLENLPNPTKVTITGNGASFHKTITDGTYEFSIDVTGKYTVKCDSRVELPIEFKATI